MRHMWGQLRRARRDTNHAPIVKALKAAGRSVLDLSSVGGGCPDLLVGWGRLHMLLMEIKHDREDGGGGNHPVTENQLEWHRQWKGLPVVVVRSPEEALEATGVLALGGRERRAK